MHTYFCFASLSAIILLAHSIHGMINGRIYDFGNLYLNEVGFPPLGVLLAWAIKLSHIALRYLLSVGKIYKAGRNARTITSADYGY